MLMIKEMAYEKVEGFIKDIFDEQAREYFDVVREKIEETITLVAYIEDEIVGAIVGQRTYDNMYVKFLTVSKACQKRSIGSQLLAQLEKIAKEKDIIHMTLKTRNYQAAGFYEKCGYSLYAKLEDMPLEGVTSLYFNKRLR